MVTQAAGGAQRLHHDMPVLSDFPCCDIPGRSADSKYPPLQWQQRAAKVAVHRAAAHGSWLQVPYQNQKFVTCQYSIYKSFQSLFCFCLYFYFSISQYCACTPGFPHDHPELLQ